MQRRRFLAAVGGAAALTGCLGGDGEGGDGSDGTGENGTGTEETATGTRTGTETATADSLTVATYSTFVEGEDSAGTWVKDAFESEHGATVEWTTPESEVNHYLGRAREGAPIDADVYVGLNVDDLIRIDEELDDPLFDPLAGDLDGADAIKEGVRFDPEGRAIPYDTGYVSLVYDENEVEPPGTFEDLLADEYAGDLIVQNAQSSATGRAFLLHTIKAKGEDGYLDYWRSLRDNDVRILGSWEDAYNAYSNGEAPMVVSYSTDQVYYADDPDADLSRHQIAFLNGQAYANPEGMARFAASDAPDLARSFVEFLLTSDAQGQIARRNVQYPATTNANLPESFAEHTFEPEEPVTFTYEELKGNVDGWVDRWAREIAGG